MNLLCVTADREGLEREEGHIPDRVSLSLSICLAPDNNRGIHGVLDSLLVEASGQVLP